MVGTGKGTVAAHGAVAGMQWVVVVTGLMVRVVRAAWTYLGPIWGYYEYTRAVLEYMWVCGSWWEPGTAPSGCTWGCCRHAVGWLWSLGQWCGW